MADYNSSYTGEEIDAAVGNAKTAAELKTAYESNANTNAFTDAEKANLANQSGTNTGDQDISGIATNAAAIATLDSEVVKKADYTTAHSVLVQQSGTGTPEVVKLSDNELLGKDGSSITGYSASDIRTLINVEDGADVTDTANVTAAGALMDSEVTNLAAVKAFDPTDYATAAQGTLADSALQSGDNVSDLTNDAGYLTSASTITDTINMLVETPADQDYEIWRNIPFAITVTKITTIADSGTCTLTGLINTTALGGTANSVSSSENVQTHSTSNTASAGDDLKVTVSSNSSAANMRVTVEFTRPLS
jgi:hypothetical protein